MIETNMVKWKPFNSITSLSNEINKIKLDKAKISKPILSTDQIEYLNKTIIDTYNNKERIIIYYYNNGLIYQTNGLIKAIKNNIVYINNIKLYFSQIINIKII